MRVFSARVQNGTIVPDEPIELAAGSRIIVVAGNSDARFELSAADEADLAESIAQADRGDIIPADELLRGLSR